MTAKRIARAIDLGEGPLHEFVETDAILDDTDAQLAMADEVVEDLEVESPIP